MDRRSAMKFGIAAVSAQSASLYTGMAYGQSGPIRIGLLAPQTGVVAAGGKEMIEGFNLYWNEVKNQAAGRKVEIIIEDDAGNPDTALQKARRLVEQQNVHFLAGNFLANTGLAVASYVKGNKVPYFIPVIAADELTQRARIDNVIRIAGFAASQMQRPLADWALKQGIRKVVTISQDYTFGHEQCGGFAQTFSEGGGTIVRQIWHPLNTPDFSPYLGQIQESGAQAVFAMETGADATRLITQWSNYGMRGKFTFLGAQNAADQSVIRTLGDECEGIVSASHYAEGADAPAVKKFVSSYEAAYKKTPSIYGCAMYCGARWIHAALEKVGGRVENGAEFLNAVRSTTLTDTPFGPLIRLDAYGNPIYDVVIRRVVKRDANRLWNVPIDKYTNVSQFGKYDPETYLKQPAYSRTFQGVKS
ncbi:MAG: penicillin-binding protein activator [Polaromonas sp.]|nr:penicillin-binding protein activator [Polaromonas sp.]